MIFKNNMISAKKKVPSNILQTWKDVLAWHFSKERKVKKKIAPL